MYRKLHNVAVRMGLMKVWIEVLQLASRLNLKYLRRFIFLIFLPHFCFCFPWGRPWGNHAKYCMDGKRIRCLQIVSQHVPIYLQQFPSYSNRKCKKSAFSRTAAHIFVSPGDAPGAITLNVVWMEREFDAYKLFRCMCPSTLSCIMCWVVLLRVVAWAVAARPACLASGQ